MEEKGEVVVCGKVLVRYVFIFGDSHRRCEQWRQRFCVGLCKLWRWGAIAESRAPMSGFVVVHFPRLGHPEWGGVVETTTPVRNDRDRNESIGGDDVNERDGMGGMELRGRKKDKRSG